MHRRKSIRPADGVGASRLWGRLHREAPPAMKTSSRGREANEREKRERLEIVRVTEELEPGLPHQSLRDRIRDPFKLNRCSAVSPLSSKGHVDVRRVP